MKNKQLTQNFWLFEFLRSQTAERHGIDMTPSGEVVENLTRLCEEYLQPIRDHAGMPIFISSGYRPLELNTKIGGSKTSAHIDGRAADFVIAGYTPFEACKLIENLALEYDQLIHEFGRWIHLGIPRLGFDARVERLTAQRIGNETLYQRGILQA